jgi:phosphatidylglycerophosphate synthase
MRMQVPALVVLWFHPARLAPLAAAVTFIVAALTDWADGYLARKVPACAPMPSLARQIAGP